MTLGAQMNGATATEEFVQYEVAEGVCTIWLNRPEVRNCVNWGLLTQLGEALERADTDDSVRVVLIRGRGNTFCAGADLNMLDAEFLGTTNNSVRIARQQPGVHRADVRKRKGYGNWIVHELTSVLQARRLCATTWRR